MRKALLFVFLGFFVTAAAASAQQPMDCAAMMKKMQASAKAMDERLDTLVTKMNGAKGAAKVEGMAAVLNEMVAQHKERRDQMASMMSGMQSMANCPMMAGTSSAAMQGAHHAGVMARGTMAMGFDQQRTTHHFILLDGGGMIEVTANDPADTASIDAIRAHLTHIASAFAGGDFALPMFIHDQTPPGVPEMKRLHGAITYRYEEIPRGGRVMITSSDPAGVKAVHDFLQFQIKDHGTGDSLTVQHMPGGGL